MKKIIAATALAVALPFAAVANAAPTDAGCGLGSVLLADSPDTLVFNVLGATLNMTSGNQTFGMTTGTLNCSTSNSILALQTFVNDNLDTLAVDAARGEGEALTTLATIWGMDDAAKESFAKVTQANFGDVFSSDSVTAEQVLENMNRIVSEDKALAAYTLS